MFRLLLSVQDPSLGGGNETLTITIADFLLSKGADFSMMYPTNLVKNLFFRERAPGSRDMPIRTYNPLLLANFSLYSLLAKSTMNGFNAFHGIGGQNFECLPFASTGRKFVCTVGTTLIEEWRAVFRVRRPHQKGLAYLSGAINTMTLPMLRKIEGKIFRSAAAVCTGSRYASECIKREFGLKENIMIIPPPIDTDHFKPSGKRVDIGRFILYVGRLDPRKDLVTLLKAFYEVQKLDKDLSLVLIGTGPEYKRLKEQSFALGISDKVKFLGNVSYADLPSYYRSAEAFVLTSLQEGFGIVVAEAVACGTPVVSTDCGGPRDIVNEKTGTLSKIGDQKSIAESISGVISDCTLRKNARRFGPGFARKNFSKELYCSRYWELYRELFDAL